jgi:hypothetical protein
MMTMLYLVGMAVCLALGVHGQETDEVQELKEIVTMLQDQMGVLNSSIVSLTRQSMMQSLYNEEQSRASGDSGVKQVRIQSIGTRPYHSNSYTGSAVMAIHDHSNNWRTVGLGEFVAVLNGVEFRTRHNDYALKMPHSTKAGFGEMEDIPYPDVPPSVLEAGSVDAQITEMREYFKAWANQWKKYRDYQPYFKALLCYLEGQWTTSEDGIDEDFESDRHELDAKTWFELTQKVRFTAYSGRKSNNENYAFLPMKIIDIVNGSVPVFAQWNYRILCHPLKDNLDLIRLKPIDDITARMAKGITLEEHVATRAARFEIHNWNNNNMDKEFSYRRGLLDTLFEQIPGRDNYQANLQDDAFGLFAAPWVADEPGGKLNVGYYHRRYRVIESGAMGTKIRNRGYSDRNVFMAMTSQQRVPGEFLTDCTGKGNNEVCTSWHQSWSYAIPLEIVYTTPLYNWNPYNIEYKGANTPWANSVTVGGRNGGFTAEKAYNGSRTNIFYRTPEAFFGDGEAAGDPADTSKGTVGVLNRDGEVVRVVASGTRIFLPEIGNLGILRTRYPINGVYDDGNSAFKTAEAVKDIVLNQQKYAHMMNELPPGGGTGGDPVDKMVEFAMGQSTSRDPPGQHIHHFSLLQSELDDMKEETGTTRDVDTSENNGHSHMLVVKWDSSISQFVADTCDNQADCWDEHSRVLNQLG